jgi:hypothetical protein
VSRARHPRVVTHLDDNDTIEHIERIQRKAPPRLTETTPPRSTWLVEVFDPAKHRVAVLIANAGLPPLVHVFRTGAPSYLLLPDGLAGTLVERASVTAIGDTLPVRSVFCPVCNRGYSLPAAMLHAKRGSKPGKPGRFTVRESDNA